MTAAHNSLPTSFPNNKCLLLRESVAQFVERNGTTKMFAKLKPAHTCTQYATVSDREQSRARKYTPTNDAGYEQLTRLTRLTQLTQRHTNATLSGNPAAVD